MATAQHASVLAANETGSASCCWSRKNATRSKSVAGGSIAPKVGAGTDVGSTLRDQSSQA